VETFNDLDHVALKRALPAHDLNVGDVGTVVHVYRDGAAYEVEFGTADGRTIAVITLAPNTLEPVFKHDQ